MKILILNLCSEKLHELEYIRPITDLIKKKFEVKHYLDQIEYSKYNHVIICGVPLKDFKYEKNLDKFNWLNDFEGKVLGICAGAQIIASIFGNKLKDFQEIGLQKVNLIKDDKILDGLKFPLEIYGLHNKSFESIKNFEILLEDKVPELIKHKQKEIYASLFHPEVRNHKLIENFINL